MAHQVQTKNNRRKHHVVATRTDSSIGAIGHFTPYMRAALVLFFPSHAGMA